MEDVSPKMEEKGKNGAPEEKQLEEQRKNRRQRKNKSQRKIEKRKALHPLG